MWAVSSAKQNVHFKDHEHQMKSDLDSDVLDFFPSLPSGYVS